jgi:hypothetical protein
MQPNWKNKEMKNKTEEQKKGLGSFDEAEEVMKKMLKKLRNPPM